MKSLTDKQSKIYDFIVAWQIDKGFPPTQAEILNRFGFRSLNAVRSHIMLIEKKGFIRLNTGKARGIQLISPPATTVRQKNQCIPLIGSIAAGVPVWAEQNFEDQLPVSPDLFGGGELFALHVVGDSMTGAGINNGDIAIIRKQSLVENGEIGAVLVEHEATLKRVFLSSKSLILKADNPEFEDLKYAADKSGSIQVLGRYQGIIRIGKHRHSS